MKLTPDNLKELIDMVEKNEISSKQAKEVFLEVIKIKKFIKKLLIVLVKVSIMKL